MAEIQTVNDPQNVAFSSEMAEIQIVNEPQNVALSSEMAEIQIVNEPQNSSRKQQHGAKAAPACSLHTLKWRLCNYHATTM